MAVVNSLLAATFEILNILLGLYIWVLVFSAVLSWLVAFGVVNTNNQFVRTMGDMLYRLTEPVLRPIRRFLPVMGGLDLSPLVLIFIIMFLQSFLRHLVLGA